MTHKTKGIILRSIKYGETSLVVTVFTELFGVQTYMVNGVRKAGKSGSKAGYFLPGAILDMIVYHQEQKGMQRIKEYNWSVLYKNVLSDVIKNSIALYMMELMYKCLKQPEQNESLFYFCEDALIHLDDTGRMATANMPLYFALHFSHFLGFRLSDDYDAENCILDLREGCFVHQLPEHLHFIDGENARLTSSLLKVMLPAELEQFALNQEQRRKLLWHYHDYYKLHIPEFGEMKTLTVLQDVL